MENTISLNDTIREAFARVVYTAKTHEVMIDDISKLSSDLQLAEIILLAVSASGISATLFFDDYWIKVVSAVIALISLAVALYKTNLNAEARMISHRQVANRLWLVREEYTNLICDLSEKRMSPANAVLLRNDLQKRLSEIYLIAPQVTPSAYGKAQKRLQECEDFTFKKGEINNFLPESLHA